MVGRSSPSSPMSLQSCCSSRTSTILAQGESARSSSKYEPTLSASRWSFLARRQVDGVMRPSSSSAGSSQIHRAKSIHAGSAAVAGIPVSVWVGDAWCSTNGEAGGSGLLAKPRPLLLGYLLRMACRAASISGSEVHEKGLRDSLLNNACSSILLLGLILYPTPTWPRLVPSYTTCPRFFCCSYPAPMFHLAWG